MPDKDQNFDSLVQHFEDKIYGSMKGKLRLMLLKQELQSQLLTSHQKLKLNVLDVAGGLSQMGIWLAKLGHRVTVADISINMLNRAKQLAAEEGVIDKIQWIHAPLQQLLGYLDTEYDLVMAHALLEWMDQPMQGLALINQLIKPGAYLSLSFYNYHAITIHNLLRGNLHKVNSANYCGEKGGLTPLNPLKPEDIRQWLCERQIAIESEMGMRTFSDYLPKNKLEKISDEDIIAMEFKLSHQHPFIDMARYLHFLAKKATIE